MYKIWFVKSKLNACKRLFLCLNHNPKLDYTYKKRSDFGFLRAALQIGKAKRRENVYGRSSGTDRFGVLSGEE